MGAVKEPGPGDSQRLDDEMDRARKGEGPLVTGPGQQVSQRTGHVGMRQQIIKREPVKKEPTIIDARTRPPQSKLAETPGSTAPAVPVRTLVYVEVGGLDSVQVGELCQQYASAYEGSVHGPHYIIPVRDGRLRSEMEFEAQFLETVNELCEVKYGEIVLKNGSRKVQVMRTHVGIEE